MKRIAIYISLAVIIILLLLSMWIGNKMVNIQNQGQDKPDAFKIIVNDRPVFPVDQVSKPLPMAQTKPAITIIKPLAQEKPLHVVEAAKKKTKKVEEESISSLASQEVQVEEKDVFSGQAEDSSGITILNKQPTEEETMEMNERGIIIY